MEGVMETKQFLIMFPSDWTWDVVHEMASFMNIPIDDQLFEKALFEEDPQSVNNIAKFYDPNNKENLIVVCCFNDDIFHHLIVRVEDSQSERIKKKLLEIDTQIREPVGQKIQYDLDDYTNDLDHGLNLLEKRFGILF